MLFLWIYIVILSMYFILEGLGNFVGYCESLFFWFLNLEVGVGIELYLN